MIVPLFVGREKSVPALEDVMLDDLAREDIYTLGTVGAVLQLLKLPDGTVKVLVEGENRVAEADAKAKA